MRVNLCLVILMTLASAYITIGQNRSDLEKLVETEKAFAQTARDKTVKQAFLEFLSDDAIVFEPSAVNAKKVWSARPESSALLQWNPVWADISRDDKIGYTTGDWSFHPKGKDDAPVAFGQYITIWKIDSEKNFKAVLDIGISHQKPDTVKTDWTSPQISASDEKLSGSSVPAGLTTSGFEDNFAADIRLYREGKFPLTGKAAALRETENESKSLKNSKVLKETCETIDDLSYCYGEIERVGKDGTVRTGNQLEIWRARNGRWKIVVHLYSPLPQKPEGS
ncbi:MAG: hypothetical protein R2681_05085 [Pyrinomonadaceae bacterium]